MKLINTFTVSHTSFIILKTWPPLNGFQANNMVFIRIPKPKLAFWNLFKLTPHLLMPTALPCFDNLGFPYTTCMLMLLRFYVTEYNDL